MGTLDIVEKVDSYLSEHGLHPNNIDMGKICDTFLAEMEKGLRSDSSSLAMLPTYIPVKKYIAPDENVIVLDAGGTNFRSCIVRFTPEGEAKISKFTKHTMPGSREELSAKDFFSKMVNFSEEILMDSSNIGFCFSYPTKITPERDGILLHFSKEIKASEVIGKLIGKNFLLEAESRFPDAEWNLTVLNDTVATLLSGKASAEEHRYSSYIGFILGTGTNICYIEENSNITKADLKDVSYTHQVVNIESGGFDIKLSKIDKAFYKTTEASGTYHFEKIVSGAYLGPYILFVLKKIAADLLDENTAKNIKSIKTLDTVAMDTFLHDPEADSPLANACSGSATDYRKALYHICDKLIERAAKLTAVNLSAAVIKSGKGTHEKFPVCINADGTTFYKTHNLKKYTCRYMNEFLTQKHKRYYEMVHIANSPIIGAAIAGLQNQ